MESFDDALPERRIDAASFPAHTRRMKEMLMK
jgi:hypothetical protein